MKGALERLDYIEERAGRLQPLLDEWEVIAKTRNMGKINHCSIKEKGKATRDCLTDDSEENRVKRGKVVQIWMGANNIFDAVDALLAKNVTPADQFGLPQIIRSALCFASNYIPPVDRSKINRTTHCWNTGLPIHFQYKNNKRIDGRKEKDCCSCSSCRRNRSRRAEEVAQYRKKLSDIKKRKKKDPKRYGHGD